MKAANCVVTDAAIVSRSIEFERCDERVLDLFRGDEVVLDGGFDGAAAVDASDEVGENATHGVVRRAENLRTPCRCVFENGAKC